LGAAIAGADRAIAAARPIAKRARFMDCYPP